MCGVAGIFSLSGKPIKNAQNRITAMTLQLKHRGPDSQGIFLSNDRLLALGNTRLAIVDPKCEIPQPLVSNDSRSVLSFNGEIYNHTELREALKSKGMEFRTGTDTEVLLNGLRRDGIEFLNRIDGMWSFAFYDLDQKTLTLGRDIIGERHLFYRLTEHELIFASEPGPIVHDSETRLELDVNEVAMALRYGGPGPGGSLVTGIKRLLPSHVMTAVPGSEPKTRRAGRLNPEKWQDFFAAQPSRAKVAETYEEILQEVCIRRLSRDVPFTTTLSGGLDSTLICAFASRFGQDRIRSLYAHSTEQPPREKSDELDEAEASRFTSRKLNTDHNEISLLGTDAIPVLEQNAKNGFDGMLCPGLASFQMLAREIRTQNQKVMLISDGPDELLGGYKVDKRSYSLSQFQTNSPLRYKIQRTLSKHRASRKLMEYTLGSSSIIGPLPSIDPFKFQVHHSRVGPEFLANFLPDDIINTTENKYMTFDADYAETAKTMDFSQKAALAYATTSIPDFCNLRTDRAFLNEGVESRPPFLAIDVVEFLIAAPAQFRFGRDGNTTKSIMRDIVEKRIGKEIAYRSKYGFSAPIWTTPEARKKFAYEDSLQASLIFDKLPFIKNARDNSINPVFSKLMWPMYVVARVEESLSNAYSDSQLATPSGKTFGKELHKNYEKGYSVVEAV